MDYGSPGFSVHGILQARILDWVAIPFSRRSSQPRDRTQVSRIAGRFFTIWATRESTVIIMKHWWKGLKFEEGGAIYNILITSQSFSDPVPWDCELHRISMTLNLFFSPSSLLWLQLESTLMDSLCWLIPAAAAAAKSLQPCPTLCDPIDGSPPGSPVPGILQARTLEWVAISFSMHESEKWKWSRSVVSDS